MVEELREFIDNTLQVGRQTGIPVNKLNICNVESSIKAINTENTKQSYFTLKKKKNPA